MKRVVTIGALCLSVPSLSLLQAQVVERPVPFDSAGQVYVMTPFIAERAALQAPWWPVAGDFTQARLYTANDSSYVLMVTRQTGVIERYMLTASDRDAIRAIVSRLPRSVVEPRNDARNAFVRNQTILGVFFYGPAFAGAFADNDAAVVAGYLVVAGGTFFAASEISRRMLVTRPQSDLSTNMGHNIALAGGAVTYLFGGNDRAQSAGAFVGGVGGAALGLRVARRMAEADAIGAGFGSNISALIALGTMESLKRDPTCTQQPDGTFDCSGPRISDKAEVTVILASGLIGYPLGVLYPRNATYNVTPGDIQTLYATTALGIIAGVTFLPDSPKESTAWLAGTAGGVVGMIAGDRFLVRRYDHSRGQGSRITLGTFAGGLMGAGVAALINTDLPPPLIFGGATVGGLIGLIASEKYVDAGADAGRRGARISFNSASILSIATRTPGNHSLINVRF